MKQKVTIEEHLEKLQHDMQDRVPFDFYKSYSRIKEYLEEHVYGQQIIGAALKGDGLLTDHGISHVKDVIEHMSKLLLYDYEALNIRETFLLLVAALVHDIGNVGGREGHEKRIDSIIKCCEEFERLETPIKHYAIQIAMAHGGRTSSGSRDTISNIRRVDQLGGGNIRPRALAALLRFADELADNSDRANCDMDQLGGIPKGNLIYHMYSKCLQPVIVEGVSVAFKYFMSADLATKKFEKEVDGKTVKLYLFDEILQRLKKAFCEMEYCVKHSSGLFHFEGIDATIDILPNDARHDILSIPLRFKCCGYPKSPENLNEVLERPLPSEFSTGEEIAKYIATTFIEVAE